MLEWDTSPVGPRRAHAYGYAPSLPTQRVCALCRLVLSSGYPFVADRLACRANLALDWLRDAVESKLPASKAQATALPASKRGSGERSVEGKVENSTWHKARVETGI